MVLNPDMPDRPPDLVPAGPVVPQNSILDKQTYAAPTSFVGSTRRILAKVKKIGASGPVAAGFAWTGGVLAIVLAWGFVLVWYTVALLLIGVFTIPYRFIRRGERKREHLQRAQLATMQAMMVNQQRSLNQSERPPD